MTSRTVEKILRQAESSLAKDTSVCGAEREFDSETACKSAFEDAGRRLLDVDEWRKSSTPTSYALFDESGREISSRPIATGDFIRISVYGTGKYDWVRVDSIERPSDEIVLTVTASFDPTEQPPQKEVISHFFRPEATNNFCLRRTGRKLEMYVIGLGEHTNTEFADGIVEAARNVATANLGYYLGLQKSMWKEFCARFIRVEEDAA